jgi:hypothetical protein
MTRYDPYSYGQVRLGGDKAQPATAQDPSDLLFAEAPPARPAAKADSSWELLDADVTSLLPNAPAQAPANDFGREVIGEAEPEAVAPVSVARPRPAAATAPRPALEGKSTGRPAQATERREVGVRALAAVPGATEPEAAPGRKGTAAPPRPPMRRLAPTRPRVGSLMVPAGLFASGGTGAAWLFTMQQDVVLAGITAALTLVATAFAWVLLRR